ncbi:uncharacterized protein M421DRAFT_6582 [Didymella exigua CBS 183.55]|uniref:Uncharacterized protein n=1 Tax=Didymella exigua CBS 183.55 TaxID=1150837 RepID=A0A6A5RJ81_9PLEO|nr:uncharacterized protein M421DRAFT_6582 [Didymella exigua CBS 183.55]KAF1927024.1 hypothetical protein M421DRAFT_6582 [Didymella exigua CBS 183.55]
MSDTIAYNADKLTPLNDFPLQPASSHAPESLMAPSDFNASSSMHNQAMLFAPPQTTSYDSVINALSSNVHNPSLNVKLDPSLAQKDHHQRKLQHYAREQAQQQYAQRLRQHQLNVDQRYQQQLHGDRPAQYDPQMQQQNLLVQHSGQLQQRQQHLYQFLRTATAYPEQLLTPQQTPEQVSKVPSLPFETLAISHLQLQNSIALGFKDTTLQFAQQARTAPIPQPQVANHYLPSQRSTPDTHALPTQSSTTKPFLIAPQPQIRSAASDRAEAIYRNEIAERVRLDKERWQERETHAKRRAELKKDTSAIYHNYNECLQYFPLAGRERPSPYLTGLLANQSIPAEPTSDQGLAIQYAKRNWENFWEMGDLNYVVQKAKQEIEKRVE